METERTTDHRRALQGAFDAPWPGPTGEPVLLESRHLRLQVYPQDGGRITSLQAFGLEVLRQWNPQRKAFQYGCFPMVPWVGRLGNATLNAHGQRYALPANKPPHALHGMACYSSWEIIEQSANQLTLCMPLVSPWPWPGKVLQRLSLSDDSLTLRLEIHAQVDEFPASAGWHPWFAKQIRPDAQEGELQLFFAPDWQEEQGEDELPTGNKIAPGPGPWDDCFGFSSGLGVGLQWPGLLSMRMISAAQSLVVFDKQPDATCVNPLTQPPNAINATPQWVRPGDPLVIETQWSFKAGNGQRV
jgi:aldose 1-epimerase